MSDGQLHTKSISNLRDEDCIRHDSASPREPITSLDDITGAVVDAALNIHRELGPGLLESVYEALLAKALERRGFLVERQKVIRFEYDDIVFEAGLRVDLLVERRVIVELKSLERLAPVHSKKLLTYLRLLKLPVGLLINFGGATLKEGLHRVVNQLEPSRSPLLRVNQLTLGRGDSASA
jgi:iron complex transport system substrate-binding protein